MRKMVMLEEIAATTKYPIGDGDHGAIKPSQYLSEGIPYIRVADINWKGDISFESMVYISKELNEANPKSHLFPDDIIIAKTGATIGKAAIIPTSIKIANTTSSIGKITLDKSKAIPKFILFYIQTKEFQRQMWAVSNKSAQPGFNIINLKKFLVPCPPLDEQIKIVNFLSKAEALISQRKESLRLLDELLKSTFLEMFITNTSSKNEKVTIESLARNEKGSMRTGPFGSDLLHSEFSISGYARVLGIDNVVNNVFESGEPRFISSEKFEKLKRYKVFPNDVLITIMGTTGRTAVVPQNIPLSINTKHLAAITLDPSRANPYFISYSLRNNPFIIKQLKDRTRGAIMDGLNLGIIKSLEISCPPLKLQIQFAHIVEKTEDLKVHYQTSLQELENLYGSLSQKAFKGELNLKGEEMMMAAEPTVGYGKTKKHLS